MSVRIQTTYSPDLSGAVYALVLLASIACPLLVPFTQPLIARRSQVVNAILNVAVITMPIAVLLIVQLYTWALLLEILGSPEGKRFRQLIDGREDAVAHF